jgi:hypothetical protein
MALVVVVEWCTSISWLTTRSRNMLIQGLWALGTALHSSTALILDYHLTILYNNLGCLKFLTLWRHWNTLFYTHFFLHTFKDTRAWKWALSHYALSLSYTDDWAARCTHHWDEVVSVCRLGIEGLLVYWQSRLRACSPCPLSRDRVLYVVTLVCCCACVCVCAR